MNDQTDVLKELDLEHSQLQFSSFSNDKAHAIGLRIAELAKERELSITIDITRNGHQLFHYACEGTARDNDQWIRRKSNVVNHFGKSSFYMKHFLLSKNATLDSLFYLDLSSYSAFGGSFPILIKDTGNIGTITVSGLPDEEDHNLVVSVIREFSDF